MIFGNHWVTTLINLLTLPTRDTELRKKELEIRLSNSERAIADVQGAAQSLGDALRRAQYAVPTLAMTPAEAPSVIGTYESIVKSAQNELTRLRDTNKQIIEIAPQIM